MVASKRLLASTTATPIAMIHCAATRGSMYAARATDATDPTPKGTKLTPVCITEIFRRVCCHAMEYHSVMPKAM